jgi:hypothetical protein
LGNELKYSVPVKQEEEIANYASQDTCYEGVCDPVAHIIYSSQAYSKVEQENPERVKPKL